MRNINLAVQGYNYSKNPTWYRNQKFIHPLRFSHDCYNMVFFYSLGENDNSLPNVWTMSTSENIKPIIRNSKCNVYYTVVYLGNFNGDSFWRVYL
jgi:hypothetical protein